MNLSFEDLEEVRLTVVKGTNAGSTIPFQPGARSIAIGRAVGNDVVISDSSVSRNHARIDIRADGCWIADAGSSAGVEKMGFKVGTTPEPLASGDEFKIGDTILKFEIVAKKRAQKRAVEREAAEKAKAAAPSGPPKASLFARLGLGSRRAQLLLLLIVAVVVVALLWPETKHLPPQYTGHLTFNYDAVIGYSRRDSGHLDKAVFDVPAQSDGLAIYFSALAKSGVEIRVGERVIATLPKDDTERSWLLLLVPRALGQGQTLPLTFDNLGYAPSDGEVDPDTVVRWGLASMHMLRMQKTPSSPLQLDDELAAQRQQFDRLADTLASRYRLLTALHAEAIGLMKNSGKSFLLVALPATAEPSKVNLGSLIDAARAELKAGRNDKSLKYVADAVTALEQDLDRDFRMQLNAATVAGNRGADAEQGRALAIAFKTYPDPTDPRSRIIEKRVARLGGGALSAYNEALDDLRTQ